MSYNHNIEHDPRAAALAAFMAPPEPSNAQVLAELRALTHAVNQLRIELVKPMSRIILVGDDIARITEELKRRPHDHQ